MNDIVSELGIDRAKLSMVKVTNRNGFVMKDRFDGTPYVFRPNQPLIIPPLAAMHFFAWPGDPEEMKSHTTRRFGWNRPDHIGTDKDKPFDDMFGEDRTLADIYWSNLKIEQVNYDIVPADDPAMPEADPDPQSSTSRVDAVVPADDLTHGGIGRKGRKLDL